MNNDELLDKIQDALEITINNVDENNKKQIHRLEDKVDKTNRNLDKLIEILSELI